MLNNCSTDMDDQLSEETLEVIQQVQRHTLSDEDITMHAYLIWEHEGCPEGRDKAHWNQAEEQLCDRIALDLWKSARLSS